MNPLLNILFLQLLVTLREKKLLPTKLWLYRILVIPQFISIVTKMVLTHGISENFAQIILKWISLAQYFILKHFTNNFMTLPLQTPLPHLAFNGGKQSWDYNASRFISKYNLVAFGAPESQSRLLLAARIFRKYINLPLCHKYISAFRAQRETSLYHILREGEAHLIPSDRWHVL